MQQVHYTQSDYPVRYVDRSKAKQQYDLADTGTWTSAMVRLILFPQMHFCPACERYVYSTYLLSSSSWLQWWTIRYVIVHGRMQMMRSSTLSLPKIRVIIYKSGLAHLLLYCVCVRMMQRIFLLFQSLCRDYCFWLVYVCNVPLWFKWLP